MDAQIIHVDFKPFFQDHVCEDMVHKCLKSWWSIAETEKHDCGFVETKGSDECSFPLILFVNANVVISPPYIEFGREGGILHVIN